MLIEKKLPRIQISTIPKAVLIDQDLTEYSVPFLSEVRTVITLKIDRQKKPYSIQRCKSYALPQCCAFILSLLSGCPNKPLSLFNK